MGRRGDAEFAAYFAARSGPLRRTAYLLAGNWHDADDLVQTSFVRLFAAWCRVRPETADAYLRTILVNAYLNSRRGQRGREEPVREVPDKPVNESVTADDRFALRGALAALPPGQRAAVVLRFWEDLSVAETAAVLGVSEGTVKTQTFRAVRAMRPQLFDELSDVVEGA